MSATVFRYGDRVELRENLNRRPEEIRACCPHTSLGFRRHSHHLYIPATLGYTIRDIGLDLAGHTSGRSRWVDDGEGDTVV